MINNPIIRRELIGMLRTRKAIVAQVFLVAALAVLVLLRWPVDAHADLAGSRSNQVLSVFGYGLMVVLMFLAPVFASTSIVREKKKGTLALLLNSPMNAWSITFGKLISALGYIILLLILSLPAAAACFAMGGVAPLSQLGQMYLLLLVLAIMYATLGLLISSYATTSDSAVRVTYAIILILAVVVLGPYAFLHGHLAGGQLAIVNWIRSLSPIPGMMYLLGDTSVGSSGLISSGNPAARFIILGIIASIIFCAWTAHRLHHKMLDKTRATGKITDEQSSKVKIYRRIMYLWFFDPQRRSQMIGKFTNPIMVKEQRTRRFGRGHWMMRMIGACLIISIALMLATTITTQSKGVSTLGGIMVLLQVALIVLITPSMASSLISSEIESGGWQLLQMTPLSTIKIIIGKLTSVAQTLVLLLLATLPGYLVLLYIDPSQQTIVINVLISLVLITIMCLFLSAAISSLCPRTAMATGISYAILLILCAGTLLFWIGENAPFSRSIVADVLTINPLAASLSLIQMPGFADYQLVPANWWVIIGVSIVSIIVLVAQTYRLTRPR